jgi:hypothetical protein
MAKLSSPEDRPKGVVKALQCKTSWVDYCASYNFPTSGESRSRRNDYLHCKLRDASQPHFLPAKHDDALPAFEMGAPDAATSATLSCGPVRSGLRTCSRDAWFSSCVVFVEHTLVQSAYVCSSRHACYDGSKLTAQQPRYQLRGTTSEWLNGDVPCI